MTVKTVNLTGQLKNVTMRRIEEQDAIYYIGETPVANRETLMFDITVQPEGVDAAFGSAVQTPVLYGLNNSGSNR